MSDEAEKEKGEKVPAWRFVLQELRKALVPIVVALLAGGAAGSTVSHFQTEGAKEEAVEEASRKAEAKALEVERIRGEIRKILIEEGGWDDVNRTMTIDEDVLVQKVEPGKLDKDSIKRLVRNERRRMAAQRAWATGGR